MIFLGTLRTLKIMMFDDFFCWNDENAEDYDFFRNAKNAEDAEDYDF